jgi:hypothetical protein
MAHLVPDDLSLGDGRAVAACRPAEAEGRSTARTGPRGAGRHPARAADRHPVARGAARAGLLRQDLLAQAVRSAGGRGLGRAAPRLAGTAARRRAAGLEPGRAGQRQRARGKRGGATGPNPTDRGRPGGHQAPPRRGRPRHPARGRAERGQPPRQPDARPGPRRGAARAFGRARQAAPPAGQAARRQGLRPSPVPSGHRECRARGVQPHIARRGVDGGGRLGRHRRVVARTPAWPARFRRLAVRHERRADIHLALTVLARAVVCLRQAARAVVSLALRVLDSTPHIGAKLMPIGQQ